jgi:dihydrolipoamide dehydrogenase
MVMGDLVVEVDVAVVGGGPGGYSAAFRCAELGLETVVVDAAKRLGGACLWEGCIPSKALLHVAALIEDAARARDLGVDFGEPRIALDPLRKWKAERVVAGWRAGSPRSPRPGASTSSAAARSSRARVSCAWRATSRRRSASSTRSSRPAPRRRPCPVWRSRASASWTRRRRWSWPTFPSVLLVIGGGYIGLELGQVYAALGSAVTLVEMTDGLLPGVDRALVQPLTRRCEKLFTKLRLGTRVTSARRERLGDRGGLRRRRRRLRPRADRGGPAARVGRPRPREHAREPGCARVHHGRRPLPHDRQGDLRGRRRHRRADARPSSDAPGQGGPRKSSRAGRRRFDNVVVPAVVFTDPEVAWCGLTEFEAARDGRVVKVAKREWAAAGRALTLGRTDGLTKLIADPESGRVLGVGIVGPGAGELIAEGALAIEAALTVEDLAATIHTHPTLSETLMEAAESLLKQG